jgi:hypothetical protein
VSAAAIAITLVAVAANGSAAILDFTRSPWVLGNMARIGVPENGLRTLGALKLAGALGLLAGLAVPPLGVAAGLGLCAFFVGAVVVTARSGWYAHLPYPTGYLLLAAAALAVAAAAA